MNADPLHAAFERFLKDRDEAALLAAVHRSGGRAPSADEDTPVAHRIRDVLLGGSAYRVVRVADPDDRTTKLYIYPTDAPSFAQPGVPFALQGEALWQWVEDELHSPTEGRVDWRRYDPSLADDA
jgi:hypothetical protein